jgi:hypothetical protein
MIRFTEEQKMIKRYGRPDGTIYDIFQFSLPAVAPFIFHVFFIGFCFLSGRHRFFQTIFPTDTITELAYFMIITLV